MQNSGSKCDILLNRRKMSSRNSSTEFSLLVNFAKWRFATLLCLFVGSTNSSFLGLDPIKSSTAKESSPESLSILDFHLEISDFKNIFHIYDFIFIFLLFQS